MFTSFTFQSASLQSAFVARRYAPRWLSTISCPTCTRGIIVNCWIMVIALSGVQFCLKSDPGFQNRLSKLLEFDLKSQVRFQNKIIRHEVQLGYSRKNPHPHDGRYRFLTPSPTWISKTAWAALPSGFSSSKTPPPIWISIKLLDTVILIYTQCRRILLSTLMIFLSNKSQFSMNSVFVVKVKIPFSHLFKQA